MGSQLLSIFFSRLQKSRSIKMFKLCCLLLVVYMVAAEETIIQKRTYGGYYNRPYYGYRPYRPYRPSGNFNNNNGFPNNPFPNNNNPLAGLGTAIPSFLAGLAAGGVGAALLSQLA